MCKLALAPKPNSVLKLKTGISVVFIMNESTNSCLTTSSWTKFNDTLPDSAKETMYGRKAHVTKLLSDLKWQPLSVRRKQKKTTTVYNISWLISHWLNISSTKPKRSGAKQEIPPDSGSDSTDDDIQIHYRKND